MASVKPELHSSSESTLKSGSSDEIRPCPPVHSPCSSIVSRHSMKSGHRSQGSVPLPSSATMSGQTSLKSKEDAPRSQELGRGVDNIEIIHKQDDIEHMPQWRRRLYALTPIAATLSIGSYWVYFFFRIKFTLDAQEVSNKIFFMAWVFIFVEMGVAFPMMLHQIWSLFLYKGRERPKARLRGDDVPTVDVFITCCGEDVDVVLDTTRAACVVDYPTDRFRVVVLDDGKSAALSAAIEGLRKQYPNLYYTARTKIKGVPHHFKAGNMNHGLDLVHQLKGGAGEYMAALDADMIPEPIWLRTVIAHMILDPKVALACPPQLFYNVPLNDPLLQSLDYFVHISEPIKDALGVAWCTGSGYAVRRVALDAIGGFPTGSLAEDVCTSSILLGAGWKTAYVHEPLQFGTVPDTFTGHVKQRTRWAIGTIQTSFKLKFCLWGPLAGKMTFFQRFCNFVYTITTFFTIFLVFSLLTMPVVLISGGRMIAYTDLNQLRWLLRMCFIALVSGRLTEFVGFLPTSYRLGLSGSRAMMWMAPYISVSIIQNFFLPSWLGKRNAVFAASGSIANELNERYPALRAPLHRRLKAILWDCRVFIHALYILFCFAAATYATVHAFTETETVSERWIHLLTHAFWPPVLWLICVAACWTPIHYAISPPDMPDREELLDRDPVTGVAHPKECYKLVQWSKTKHLHELQYSAMSIFTAVIFFGSFFI